jgi:hypothetical protein
MMMMKRIKTREFVLFMKRASAIKVVLSCTGLAGNKKKKRKKRSQFQFYFFSEIGNFNVGGPVNQLIIKKGLIPDHQSTTSTTQNIHISV